MTNFELALIISICLLSLTLFSATIKFCEWINSLSFLLFLFEFSFSFSLSSSIKTDSLWLFFILLTWTDFFSSSFSLFFSPLALLLELINSFLFDSSFISSKELLTILSFSFFLSSFFSLLLLLIISTSSKLTKFSCCSIGGLAGFINLFIYISILSSFGFSIKIFFNDSLNFPGSKSCGSGWKFSRTVSSDSSNLDSFSSSFIKFLSKISFLGFSFFSDLFESPLSLLLS